MPSAGLLALLLTFPVFKPMQAKHFLVETEDNSEPMRKEEVDAVLDVILEEDKQKYESLNKTVKKAIQKEIKKKYGNDIEGVR